MKIDDKSINLDGVRSSIAAALCAGAGIVLLLACL